MNVQGEIVDNKENALIDAPENDLTVEESHADDWKKGKSWTVKKALNEWGLTPKQLLFVTEYAKNGCNGTAAYKAAINPDADDKTACVQASEWIGLASVTGALRSLLTSNATPESVVGWFSAKRHTAKSEEVQIRANDALAKIHGLYQNPSDARGNVNMQFNISIPSSKAAKTINV